MKTVTAIKNYLVTAIMAIIMSSGDTLWATPEHPFWVDDQYVEASELTSGDRLLSYNGNTIYIDQIIHKDTTLKVYNFTVEGNNNYFAGHSGVLVHNDCLLKKIDAKPVLKANLEALPDNLKAQFLEDFVDAGKKALDVLNMPNGVKAWEGMYKGGLESAIRKNPDYVKNVSDYSIRTGINADDIVSTSKNNENGIEQFF